jgi:glycosyltransferase involved in cell wall biosynthesis
MVDQLGIRSGVRFHGWVPHLRVEQILRVCDFMALPSIREFGGGVVVEAMALGVTPIVADYAGPSELVDDRTGIRVGFHDKQSLIEGLRRVMGEVIRSPELLDRLGAAAQHEVREKLSWEAKAGQILAVYDAVLSGAEKLNFLDYQR